MNWKRGAVNVSWERDADVIVVERRAVAHLLLKLIHTLWLCLSLTRSYFNLSEGCGWACLNLLLAGPTSTYFVGGILVSAVDGMALLRNPRGLHFDSLIRIYYELHMMSFLSTDTYSMIVSPRSMASALSRLHPSPTYYRVLSSSGPHSKLSLQPWNGLIHNSQLQHMLPSALEGAY